MGWRCEIMVGLETQDKLRERQEEDLLADYLLSHQLVLDTALDRARHVQDKTNEPLAKILLTLGLISEMVLADAFADCLNIERLGQSKFPQLALFEDRLNPKFLINAMALPVEETSSYVKVAMANPIDSFALKAFGFMADLPVQRCVSTRTEIELAIEHLYLGSNDAYANLEDLEGTDQSLGYDLDQLRDLSSDAPVIRAVNQMIARAVELGASDIHVEPMGQRVRIRYRIDGVLQDMLAPPQSAASAVISRIKVIAGLDIAERRLPQDGRIRLAVQGTLIDMRVSTAPTLHGESVVMRILDRSRLTLDFESLGFDEVILPQYLDLLKAPYGVLLVTGPTGSGKTTTLYGSLTSLNSVDRKILTIEDPIEYMIEGINQSQVLPDIGYSFAKALRSFLRQDPDVIMVGEIRDHETAETAIQAALTGHLILSTLHTNDAASAVTRLLDMDVDDFLITSTVLGVLAQRLVRRLCPDCRKAYTPDAATRKRFRLEDFSKNKDIVLYRPVGCAQCNQTGYRSQTALLELMILNDNIRSLILQRAEPYEIKALAQFNGMRTIFEDGVTKALKGITTIEEVTRVTRSV